MIINKSESGSFVYEYLFINFRIFKACLLYFTECFSLQVVGYKGFTILQSIRRFDV